MDNFAEKYICGRKDCFGPAGNESVNHGSNFVIASKFGTRRDMLKNMLPIDADVLVRLGTARKESLNEAHSACCDSLGQR